MPSRTEDHVGPDTEVAGRLRSPSPCFDDIRSRVVQSKHLLLGLCDLPLVLSHRHICIKSHVPLTGPPIVHIGQPPGCDVAIYLHMQLVFRSYALFFVFN